ncbi:hypothetical protein GCM10027047_19220 [Rhodococcus aerolatus]
MARPLVVRESVEVAADVGRVWAAVSDPTETHRWSPENVGATVTGPLEVGATFEGRNRRFGVPWSTRCTVVAREEHRRFAFRVEAIGARTPRLRARIATWEYRLEPVPGGTRVTETWTDDRRWPDAGAAVFDRLVTRGSTFAAHNRANIRATLAGLQRELGAGA